MRALLLLTALLLSQAAAARTVALIVGVGRYTSITPLDGPAHDVPAMRDLVIRRMGAQPQDVVVLQDQAATAAAIRRELAALVTRSAPGDKVIIYFSGHGTSARDENARGYNLPDGTGAFVPFDIGEGNRPLREQLIVGRFDLRPLALEPLDKGGREVLLIMDSCYSGNAARGGLKPGIGYRYAAIGAESDPLLTAAAPPPPPANSAPQPYPYARVSMLAAAAETEKAADLPAGSTLSGKPQGALTDALLRLFEGKEPADYDRNGQVSLVEAARGVSAIIGKAGLSQTPQLLPSLDHDPLPIVNTAVPGMPALPVPAQPLVVALPASLAGLAGQLQAAGITTRTGTAGDLVVASVGGRTDLRSGAGDLILAGATPAQIIARARAQAWAAAVLARARLPLRAEILPAAAGGSFVIGKRDAISFGLVPGRAVQPLVVDITPDGKLQMLYPVSAQEVQRVPANARTLVADAPPIIATPPAGTDRVLVIGLEAPPPGLDRWFGLSASFDSSDAQAFVQWLAALPGASGALALDLRIIAP